MSLRALALAAALLGLPASAEEKRPARPDPRIVTRQLDGVETGLRSAEESLRFVETQYTQRLEPTEDDSRVRRFSDGEIHYLLGDWQSASVLFYDLVGDKGFRSHPRYADALFYLADSLFQQQNYIAARLYLRELLALPTSAPRYGDALSRYLAVAGRLNQYEGIDAYVQKARTLYGGQLPPEVAYVYGKWTFRRADLPPSERIARARAAFAPLAQLPDSPFRLQAAYHLGVLAMQAGELPAAIEQFQQLATLPAVQAQPAAPGVKRTPSDPLPAAEVRRIRELALMSLGRLLYETGRFDEALDRYSQVPSDSESFPDSLYELAWVHVRKGDYRQAKNAIDILLMVAPASQLVPEARILQGNLLQKLKRYDEATGTYTGVIDTFRPERDQVDALLRSKQDPAAYFDRLLGRAEGATDVGTLLPPVARRYASAQREVAEAVRLVGDIDLGRKGSGEARTIAERILETLDSRGLEAFPELQEGYTRADAVESALTHADAALVQLESSLMEEVLTPGERETLVAARREREALEKRFATLPTNQRELEERRNRMQAKVDAVDREAFRLGTELQGLNAVAAAIRKWVDDTRAERNSDPAEEREFLVQLQAEIQTLTDVQAQLDATRAKLADARNSVDTALEGEQAIRTGYAGALKREHEALRAAEERLPADSVRFLERAHAVRQKADGLRTRTVAAKAVLRDRLLSRGRAIREKVVAEQRLLDGYDAEVAAVTGESRGVVGRIAYDSIRRVRQQFYDLVLRADVGVVDTSFTAKQDKTAEIQKLSKQKDDALRELDAEFQPVLSEGRE
jgi:tetratricopeptide (TPR) repeat protein